MKANLQNMVKLAKLYAGVKVVNFAMLVIIILVYSEPISLMMDPFNWLGRTAALNSSPNTGSFLLFNVTLLFNVFIWKRIFVQISESSVWSYPPVSILGYLVLAGFLLMFSFVTGLMSCTALAEGCLKAGYEFIVT